MSKYNLSDILNEGFKDVSKEISKQKGKSKKDGDRIAGYIANLKRKGAGKGPTKKQKARMSELDGGLKRQMDDLVDRQKVKNFELRMLGIFKDFTDDNDERFSYEDIVDYLSTKVKELAKNRKDREERGEESIRAVTRSPEDIETDIQIKFQMERIQWNIFLQYTIHLNQYLI